MNVLIRPLELDDASISFKWRNDPEIWKFTGSKPTIEVTEAIEKEWLSKTISDKTKSRFAILVDNVYVGNVQLTDIIEGRSAEFHIFIGDKNYWGKGVASQATYQILFYAKEYLNLKEVFLQVNTENLAAIKSYENNGFLTIKESSTYLTMRCDLNELLQPTVSIFCMVYNHENFLKNALEGFLFQKMDFNSIIVVGEDCSSDSSREILLEYKNRYPGKFKLILNEKNVGAKINQKKVLSQCQGKFVAMCEGDDYWTDPYKLQKQVDFLESSPEFVMCFHKVKVLKKDGKMLEDFLTKVPNNYQERVTLLKKGNYIHTPSVMFRNHLIEIPDVFYESPIGDFLLYVLLTNYGKIGYIDKSMAVYRHNVGVLSKDSDNNFKNQLLMNLVLLKIVHQTEDIKIVLDRILNYVLNYIVNLPLNILIRNIKGLGSRFIKKINH